MRSIVSLTLKNYLSECLQDIAGQYEPELVRDFDSGEVSGVVSCLVYLESKTLALFWDHLFS